MTGIKVPLVDLAPGIQKINRALRQAIDEVLSTNAFVLGPYVETFEREFAQYCRVKHAVGVANGTDAVELALRGAGIGAGDEVILPANTFVATAEAVVRCGATPVIVDCDEDFLIDPDLIAERVTARTRAVIPVHLYGQMARVEDVRAAVGSNIFVVEDSAQSQGASRGGRPAGSLGDIAATSFYPGKNLGAFGDAGAVMTNSDEFAARIRAMRNHGGTERYEHRELGMNSRLDGIQAAVLSVKLGVLDEWNQQRRDAADFYASLLAELPGVLLPRTVEGNVHVWHLYVVRVPHRDHVLADLNAAGIGAGLHYPLPVHLLPAFSYLGYSTGDFPVAEKLGGEILSLPMYPGITREQQRAVASQLTASLRG